MNVTADDITSFWLERIGPEGWYEIDRRLDAEIRERFEAVWERARQGEFDLWMCMPRSCLALLVLLDQFPRNMFRDTARAFASDSKALGIAHLALRLSHDSEVSFPARQFFYLPFMHAESPALQDRAVRLFSLNDPDGNNLVHARAHRWIIREFGRFPYRNRALGRMTSPSEQNFLDAGGYCAAMKAVRERSPEAAGRTETQH